VRKYVSKEIEGGKMIIGLHRIQKQAKKKPSTGMARAFLIIVLLKEYRVRHQGLEPRSN
jgi:hypothetical protein